MMKRELIDRNNLESTTIVTDDFSGNEVLDVVLMEDVKETPIITEQEIVKPYIEAIKAEEIKYKGTGQVEIQAYADGLYKAIEIINNLLSQEVKNGL